MLEWETGEPNEVVAYLNGYSYTITEDEDEEVWEAEVTTPDGGVSSEICGTIEEAKQFCENTASAVQAEE
jgi:hypothetical protein